MLLIAYPVVKQPTIREQTNEQEDAPGRQPREEATAVVNAGTVQQYIRGFGGANIRGWIADLYSRTTNHGLLHPQRYWLKRATRTGITQQFRFRIRKTNHRCSQIIWRYCYCLCLDGPRINEDQQQPRWR